MDEQRFDRLARSFASGRSRRNVLRGMLGGLAAGLFLRNPQAADADAPRALRGVRSLREPRELRSLRNCRSGQTPNCAGQCCPGDTVCYQNLGCMAPDEMPCAGGTCPGGYTCSSTGGCLPAGGIECGGGYCEGDHICVNAQGCLPPGGTACGSGYCASGLVCVNDQCERACDAGTTRCGGDCADLLSSTAHCGACGVPCGPGQICDGGVCGCPSGTTRCGDSCVDLLIDEDHCGACDTPCHGPACMDAVCVEGQCQRTPIANCCTEDADCDDENPCTINTCDLETSTCHTAMEDFGESCPSDDDPCTLDICDGEGACAHLDVEDDHICITPEGHEGVCRDHLCVIIGPGPDICEEDCSGTCCDENCTNLQTDPLNCGACGNACAAGESCVDGMCEEDDICDLEDWHQYSEWVGTLTRVSSFHDAGGDIQNDMELEIHAEIRLRLTTSPSSSMFFLTPYAGTCSAEYNRLEAYTPGDHSRAYQWSTHAEGTTDISAFEHWVRFSGGTVYGDKVYVFGVDECITSARTTFTGRNGTTVFDPVELTFPAIVHGAAPVSPLPECPGAITGEWEHTEENGGAVWYDKETWSFTPVAM